MVGIISTDSSSVRLVRVFGAGAIPGREGMKPNAAFFLPHNQVGLYGLPFLQEALYLRPEIFAAAVTAAELLHEPLPADELRFLRREATVIKHCIKVERQRRPPQRLQHPSVERHRREHDNLSKLFAKFNPAFP